jgi:hypothetical protein
MTGCHLNGSWRDTFSDNSFGAHKISLFVQLRTLAASGLSWLLLLAVEMKSLDRRDSSQNHYADAARDDGG